MQVTHIDPEMYNVLLSKSMSFQNVPPFGKKFKLFTDQTEHMHFTCID